MSGSFVGGIGSLAAAPLCTLGATAQRRRIRSRLPQLTGALYPVAYPIPLSSPPAPAGRRAQQHQVQLPCFPIATSDTQLHFSWLLPLTITSFTESKPPHRHLICTGPSTAWPVRTPRPSFFRRPALRRDCSALWRYLHRAHPLSMDVQPMPPVM